MQFCPSTFLTYRKNISPPEGLRGTGVPRRPSRRSEGLDASPSRHEYFSQLRAMVLEDLQIAN
jgi:hypothetical protein